MEESLVVAKALVQQQFPQESQFASAFPGPSQFNNSIDYLPHFPRTLN